MSDEPTKQKIDDGGPAFPVPYELGGKALTGMTLRDWMGGMAMMGMINHDSWYQSGLESELAINAYKIADAMLRAREGR